MNPTLFLLAAVSVGLGVALGCFYIDWLADRRRKRVQAQMDRVLNAAHRYERVTNMQDSAGTKARYEYLAHLKKSIEKRLEVPPQGFDRERVETAAERAINLFKEHRHLHPRDLDRLYIMDEHGYPLMKRGTECD